MYNWQQQNWPNFRYSLSGIKPKLYQFSEKIGNTRGLLESLSEVEKQHSTIEMLTTEAIKTSEIEGEFLSREDVRSSIINELGFGAGKRLVSDRRSEGIGKLMVRLRETYTEPLTKETLFIWHTLLMAGSSGISIGSWRSSDYPMRIVSGPVGNEIIHFEAPPSSKVPVEMSRFFDWFEKTAPNGEQAIEQPLVRAAIAHLYFESIHPFEDGNGRIGRAISEKSIAQFFGKPMLFSLSKTISKDRKVYYNALNKGQHSNEISDWIRYFVDLCLDAQSDALESVSYMLKKVRFFDTYHAKLNVRQTKALRKMLDEGPDGFEGGMSVKKYVSITRSSKATATRDLRDLVIKMILTPSGEGRGRRYFINLP
jgi:Fic family protein